MTSAQAALIKPTELLRDPSSEDWKLLNRFDGTLTREQFEERLLKVFDPFGGISPFLNVTDREVTVFASSRRTGSPLAKIAFASAAGDCRAFRDGFRPPQAFHRGLTSRPLSGLRVVIEPADIGGRWGAMEDRSSNYNGYGRIQEGDLTLTVAKLLRTRLQELGADVFVTRDRAEPVCGFRVSDVSPVVFSSSFQAPVYNASRLSFPDKASERIQPCISTRIAAEVLLTKNLEARARAEKARRVFNADITIVLQFDASPASSRAGLTSINRNIFFVEGAYTTKELSSDARQRLKLLTKLLENVTPTETRVAVSIARCFEKTTGFPPVLYGNTATTRAVSQAPLM